MMIRWMMISALTMSIAVVNGGIDVNADDFARHLWVTEASLDGGANIVYYWALQIVDDAYLAELGCCDCC